ncbi:hypothetical protein KSS87_019262 [Heliosperma pusillum]|nr:hypothetical protein KSS87_019262 [Heliosperma pusillum]
MMIHFSSLSPSLNKSFSHFQRYEYPVEFRSIRWWAIWLWSTLCLVLPCCRVNLPVNALISMGLVLPCQFAMFFHVFGASLHKRRRRRGEGRDKRRKRRGSGSVREKKGGMIKSGLFQYGFLNLLKHVGKGDSRGGGEGGRGGLRRGGRERGRIRIWTRNGEGGEEEDKEAAVQHQRTLAQDHHRTSARDHHRTSAIGFFYRMKKSSTFFKKMWMPAIKIVDILVKNREENNLPHL